MPVARLSFSGYQSSNENSGGGHSWLNIQGAGATAEGAGAYTIRDPNSANMNWLRSQGDGVRGSATIPDGATINGIIIGFKVHQYNGAQTGGTYEVQIFKNGVAVGTPKTGAINQGNTVGPFGASNDLWGLGVIPSNYFTGIYFGHHCNFPSITADITVYSWDGYMDIYYTEAVSVPASITVGAGNGQTAQINTQYGQQLYAIVRNQAGSPMQGVSVTFTMPGSGASALFNNTTLTATAITNSSGGAVSPFFTANAIAGLFQPVADVTGSSPLIFTRFYAENTSPPPVRVPTTLQKVQGDNQQAAVSTQFAIIQKVKLLDQFGVSMPNLDITWPTPSATRGTYAGGTPAHSLTDSLGIATAPRLTAGTFVGAWAEASFVTDAPAVIGSFNMMNLADNSPPTATSVQIVSGDSQKAALNGNFPTAIKIKILDQYGSGFPGASVTATTPGASYGTWLSNSSTSKTVTSGSDGVADFGTLKASGTVQSNWAITIVGTSLLGPVVFTANGSVTGLSNVDATIVTSLSAISGMAQIVPVSTTFASPLQARATNGLGAGVQNFSVTFTAPGSAASCRFSGALTQVVLTDANGFATSVNPVATATAGSYTVTASGSGVSNALFPLQNGLNYAAEVCTSYEAPPSGCINTLAGGVGSPISNWGSPQNAIGAAATATAATCNQAPPNSNRSNYMVTNRPASWNTTNIPNDAKVTRVLANWWAKNDGAFSIGLLSSAMRNDGATTGSEATQSLTGSGNWQNQVDRQVTIAGASQTGSFWNSGATCGFAFRSSSTSSGTGSIDLNGLTIRICYQLLIPPPKRVIVPLAYCPA